MHSAFMEESFLSWENHSEKRNESESEVMGLCCSTDYFAV
jgi:hypothetical protein